MKIDALNDPSQWTADASRPSLDVKSWQQKIDRIVGLNRDGKSIIRLVWMPDIWTPGSIFGERIKRYWVRRYKDGETWMYVSPPRWGLERRLEKGAYYDSHQATRYQIINGEVVDFGPPPDEYFVFDEGGLIAEHDKFYSADGQPKCCDIAWEGESKFHLVGYEMIEEKVNARRRCWGYYREPSEVDLNRLRQAVKNRDAQKYFDPYQPLSREQLAVIEIEANMQAQRVDDEFNNRLGELSRDFNNSHGWILDASYKQRRHGKYHFLSNFKQQGGIYVPN